MTVDYRRIVIRENILEHHCEITSFQRFGVSHSAPTTTATDLYLSMALTSQGNGACKASPGGGIE